MGKIIKQILSNETINDKGYLVFSDSIDWSRYSNNNTLLWDHDWKQVIGNVVNIRRDGDDWLGDLVFDMATDLSREKAKQYEFGSLNAVSLAGKIFYTEKDGIKFVDRFLVYEISLVPIPSNEDAIAIRDGKTPAMAVNFTAIESEEIVEFSARHNSLITNYYKKMEEEKKVDHKEEDISPNQDVGFAADDAIVDAAAKKVESSFAKSLLEAFRCIVGKNESDEKELDDEDDEEIEEDDKDADEAEEDKVDEGFTAEIPKAEETVTDAFSSPKVFDEKEYLNKEKNIKITTPMAKQTVNEYFGSSKQKFAELSSFVKNKEGKSETQMRNDSRMDFLQEFAHTISTDAMFRATMGNITFSSGDKNSPKYDGTLNDSINRIEAFASGAKSSAFVLDPDLARVEWISLIYRLLFPEETWAGKAMRIAGGDRAGTIWVESNLDAKVYMGDRAPLGQSGNTYDDTPVGLVMKLFALQNLIWQQSNTDLLAYNDVSLGMSEALRTLQYKMHNYYLQKIAEKASFKIPTSGTSTFSAANAFPANPSATGTLKQLTPADILKMQTAFINQNYTMDSYNAELILPAIFMEQLQNNENVTSILTKNAGAINPMGAQYAGFNINTRPITSLVNTATTSVVDAELYLDGKISSDGSIPTYTPPVIPATAVGVGVGFIPEQCVIALGNTNVHMVADPSNYGWRMSMDIRTGAGAGRQDGTGIGLIYAAPNA